MDLDLRKVRYFVVLAEELNQGSRSSCALTNVTDLFLAMADLSERKAWFGATNWSGVARRIVFDTNRYADERLGETRTN